MPEENARILHSELIRVTSALFESEWCESFRARHLHFSHKALSWERANQLAHFEGQQCTCQLCD